MTHGKGWDAVMNCLNQSKITQSWCQKRSARCADFNPNHDTKTLVVTILEPIYQSQHSPTIHYIHNETLEGSSCCEFLESIQTYSILMWNRCLLPKLTPSPTTQESGCDDDYIWWIQIVTSSNHSLYIQLHIGRVEMLWTAWIISPKSLDLDVKSEYLQAVPTLIQTTKQKHLWWSFWSPYTNLNLLQPFTILIMRLWKGEAAVNFLNQSESTQYWCET